MYEYTQQPGPSSETCNIIGSGANITCAVTGPDRSLFSILWHFTQNPQEAGVANNLSTGINTGRNLPSYTFNPTAVSNSSANRRMRGSILTISKLDDSTIGYYWCSVLGQPNPSQVVHIQECPIGIVSSCKESTTLSQTSTRCAESTDQEVSIVEAQDLACELSTAPPTAIPTKKDDSNNSPTQTLDNKPETTFTVSTGDTTVTGSDEEVFSTLATTATQGQPPGTSTPEGAGLPIDIVWLIIGIVLALLLVGVIILLAVIATLQCKKRRVKGKVRNYLEGIWLSCYYRELKGASRKEPQFKI